jgi:hypothetical protein
MVAKCRADHEDGSIRTGTAPRVPAGPRTLFREILHRYASENRGVVSRAFPKPIHRALQLPAMLVQFATRFDARLKGGIMPLHYGKIFGIIALLTILAFVLWQLWIALFAGEAFEQKATPHAEATPLTQPLVQTAAAD